VAGSGPAYVYYLAEAMVKAAVEVGFDRDTALWMVRFTISGAAALMDAADQPPENLRAAVTSKGGTTAAAAAALDAANVKEAFVRAIKAARDRGAELAAG
jgi:pyrroline-5-carboxylate reductase